MKDTNEDLLLGPYKLPLKKLKFGYYGAVSLTKDGKGILCHVCGQIKENLALHVRMHDLTVRQYREKFGISLNTPLVSEHTRKASVERMLALREKMKKEGSLDKIIRICNEKRIASMKEKMKNGTWKKGKTWLKAEDLNLRGICPDQLIQLIHDSVKHFGYVPSYAEFMGFHRTNRFATPFRRTFGGWKQAVEKAGYKPKQRTYSVLGGKLKYTDEELLDKLADFHSENQRPPTLSDFKQGYLPNWEVYKRRFGSMQEARRKAGIEKYIVPRGGSRLRANEMSM